MHLTVVILTKNEERHIERCIDSVTSFATDILVVDSGSTDRTVELAEAAGARVLSNPWTNYATQLNWGIDRVGLDAEWVMRLDADEIVQPDLAEEIRTRLSGLPPEVDGVYVSRHMTFLGRPIRWGGVFPVRMLRLFRNGRGRCEMRWMDEHILVEGAVANFRGSILDDNLNSLTWWIEKHNSYASREAVDLLNLEYGFIPHETVADLSSGQQAGVKRWLKEKVYTRLPGGVRAFMYFFYRYVVRLGFLDGKEGAAFHVLQGLWYRYLVDAKIYEVRKEIRAGDGDPVAAIRRVLNIDLTAS
ncbi:glycosyltransferase family 2 protein [Citreimonas salinaria]|uniref:Glycosyltransferase involved in cell wall bisynthesis n=1 Tax=Citreimonas salinaria TaxID=321339 RepID=A0A1H3EYV2_9RHOB|nr:glycosyltransferase family 2 protein [Citreimonas salinaria]SDX83966.1 Glycosyltransferase involved in cell wall bisynthesis [Citreimonas salinaria]